MEIYVTTIRRVNFMENLSEIIFVAEDVGLLDYSKYGECKLWESGNIYSLLLF